MAVMLSVFFVLCLVFLTSSTRTCTEGDYLQLSLPCDEKTRTRSIVHYLKANCANGTTPPVPINDIPCDCGPGLELPRGLQSSRKCQPCQRGEYGAGGEIINNWREWTHNGTMPPAGSNIITYCEKSRDYVKFCEAWKASADNFTIESGDNTLSRCMSSVLLMTKKFVSNSSKVTFDYYVDSRECRSTYLGCDGLAFFIDSQQVLDYAGNQFQWKTMTYNLKPGIHILKWIFRKACYSYGISFVDKAFIRSITLVGIAEPDLRCKKCPPGYYGNTTGAWNCSACSYFQYQSKEGRTKCEVCPSNTYSMLGASKCLPLPNCTINDVIKPPGNVSSCSCKQSTNCTTTVQPSYVKVKGFKAPRILCNPVGSSQSLKPEKVQCRCQPGFQINMDGESPRCQACENGAYSTYGVTCNKCPAGRVALKGKHFYVWRNNTLPEGFTAQCSGDCSVKNGWISAGGDIRTERVVGNVHAVLQSPEVEVVSLLGRIVFNCSIICNMTGVSPKLTRGEHLAKIKDCNLVFQVWRNNTLRDQMNCTYPKGRYHYQHEKRRDGETVAHIVPLKKGKYFFRWVFHQEDDTRTLSTAFQAKVSNISILGTKEGEARNCTPCPAGYQSSSGNTDCTICPNGTSSPVGSEKCIPCQGESFAGKEGSATCLPCGDNTHAFPKKDGCDTGSCKFSPAEGVVYDLIKLARVGGPMIEVLTYQTGPRPKRSSPSRVIIWPYKPEVYVNLCTVEHDNTSCTYRDPTTREKLPLPVMACRSSWYNDISIGSVIGYKAKSDVRSGLIVELLHGDKCYAGGKIGRYRTTLDLKCDIKAGVGNPGPQTNFSLIVRQCEYYLVWKSLYACPKCRKGDVTTIRGECINGTRNITYLPSVPCWGTGDGSHEEFKKEPCETPTKTVTVTVNGTVVAYRIQKSNKVNKILIGVGVVVILVLLGVAVFFVYKHRVMKYRYYTLMARNKPMSRLAQEDDEDNLIHEDELAEPAGDEQGPIKI